MSAVNVGPEITPDQRVDRFYVWVAVSDGFICFEWCRGIGVTFGTQMDEEKRPQ